MHLDVETSFSSALPAQLSSLPELSLEYSSSESLSFSCSLFSLCDKSFPIASSGMFRSKQELPVAGLTIYCREIAWRQRVTWRQRLVRALDYLTDSPVVEVRKLFFSFNPRVRKGLIADYGRTKRSD